MPLDVIQGGMFNPFDKYNTPASPILFPVGERNVGWQQRDGAYRRTPEHKAIIRLNEKGDNAQILNIVGSGYKLVHNRELFTAVEDAMISEMPPGDLSGVQVRDRVSGWGKICYREYVFPNIRRRLTKTVGDIGFRVIVQNGYGGSALRIHAGAIDFYCTNGMIRGEYVSAYRRHTSRLVLSKMNDTITHALSQYAIATDEWQQWAEIPVTNKQTMDLFRAIAASDKMRDGLTEQFMREQEVRGQNLWAVYSTLTHYASHPEGAFAFRKTVEEADAVAATMLRHEMDVARWTRTDQWKAMQLA